MGFKFLVEMGMKREWDRNGNEVIEMGGIWYEKNCSRASLDSRA